MRSCVRRTGGALEELVIREACFEDAEALCSYAAQLFSEGLPGLLRRPLPTLEQERDFIAGYGSTNSTLVVAELAGRVVGLAGLVGRVLEQESHVGSLGISVDRDYRGRGVGTRLLEHLVAWAPSHGVTRIELEAFSSNPRAIALYEQLGFEREGVRRGAVVVDGESVDVVCMARMFADASA